MENTPYFITVLIISVLSLIGCALMLLEYVKQRPNPNFASKLLAILSTSDAIYVIAILIDPNPENENALCTIQALLKQCSSLSIFIVIFFLCYTTHLTVVQGNDMTNKRYVQAVKMLTIIFPFFVALIPLCFKGYGIQRYACGFKDQGYYWIGEFFLFFIPFIALIFGSVFYVVRILRFLKEIRSQRFPDDEYKINRKTYLTQNSQLSEGQQYTKFLLYYTFVHFVCWIPLIIYQVSFAITKKDYLWLGGLRFIFACSQGLLDFILFYISKKISTKTQPYDVRQSMLSEQSVIDDIYRGSAIYNSSL